MRWLSYASVALPVAVYGWLVTASAIYLWGVERLSLFRFPFMQWLKAAPWVALNLNVMVWVIISAAFPTLVLVAIVAGLVRFCWKANANSNFVYGNTGWATDRQMKDGGLELRDSL